MVFSSAIETNGSMRHDKAVALIQESWSFFISIRIFSCQVEACLDYLNQTLKYAQLGFDQYFVYQIFFSTLFFAQKFILTKKFLYPNSLLTNNLFLRSSFLTKNVLISKNFFTQKHFAILLKKNYVDETINHNSSSTDWIRNWRNIDESGQPIELIAESSVSNVPVKQAISTMMFTPPVITTSMMPRPHLSVERQSAEEWVKIFRIVAESFINIYRAAGQDIVGQWQALSTLPSLLNRNESEQKLSNILLHLLSFWNITQ